MASIKKVSTPQGEVKLFSPPIEFLNTIRSLLPLGMTRYIPAQKGADFGLVIKELFCVKQQPTDCDECENGLC